MKVISCSWFGRINTVKISILLILKAICRVNAISIKIPMALFIEVGKKIPKIHMEPQNTLNSQRNPEKGEQSKRHHTS